MNPLSKEHREWVNQYENAGSQENDSISIIIFPEPEITQFADSPFLASTKEAGIVSIRKFNSKLLITIDRYMSKELNERINSQLPRLVKVSQTETKKSLYKYIGYRTFISNRRPCLAVEFQNLFSGKLAERYFNIELRNNKGRNFKTGDNCEFRIVGKIKRPQKGMFIKFWLDAVKKVPDNRPSHIFRYMNSELSNIIISCDDASPHHHFIKLNTVKYEGHLFEL